MRTPITQTKLHRPRVTAALVYRKRLHERMDLGLRRSLILVSAPAGYGKSMLVSQWLEGREEPHAWLSLDEADSDLRVFSSYFIAALRTVFPDACEETLSLLEARNLPPVSRLASCLVNELEAIEVPFILALDDYQRISSGAVHDLLRHLLAHPPRHLHLVIATRRDPPLRLAAMRAKDHLVEVRLKDLEFAASETEAFLKQDSGLTPGEHALDNLQRVLEGWIAGLRLVALALRHQDDPGGFLSGLRGGLPQLQDYLIGEVIDTQPPAMREWLWKTCILDRFCPALCETVCMSDGESGLSDLDGGTFIRSLEEGNLFGIALDPRNQWYRYHHLFQGLLLEQLKRRCDAQEIATLHSRASEWFEGQGLIGEAIQHALKAGEVVAAAEICERHRHAELNADRWYVVESWLATLPAEIKQQRPGLLLAEAWVSFHRFQVPRFSSIVERVESLLEDGTAEPTLVGELNLFQGALLYWQGQGESSRKCCEKALALASENLLALKAEAELYLGLARAICGQKKQVIQELKEKIEGVESPDGLLLSRLIAGLAFAYLFSGELTHARVAAERLQTVTRKIGIVYTDAWSSYMQACTHLHCYDLDAASHHFAVVVGKRYVLHTKAAVDGLAGLALTHQAMQQPDAAAETTKELLEFARETGDLLCLSVAYSLRARISLLQGNLTSAVQWVRSFDGASEPAALQIWLEVPSITQARVLVALGSDESLGEATQLLQTLREQTEALRFTCQTIEIAVLQALALQKQGRADQALTVLEEAVTLARPGGWIRPFVEAGRPMADLLEHLLDHEVAVDYVGEILAAFGSSAPSLPASTGQLPEPLTTREEEVLELLERRLRDKEIAAQLFISPGTVKFHLKGIYQKLCVGGRREAVARGRELGILSSR